MGKYLKIGLSLLLSAIVVCMGACKEDEVEEPHTHIYRVTITKKATCLELGEKKTTCACGDTYTREIKALGHNYVNGVCSRCQDVFVPREVLKYERIDDSYYQVTGDMLGEETDVVIPETYQGLPVKSIAWGAFSGSQLLLSVEIPATIETIGEEAFDGCKNLKRITVAEDNAYYKDIDGNLYNKSGTVLLQYANGKTDESFTISKELMVKDYAFRGCVHLKAIEVAEDHAEYSSIDGNLYSKDEKELLQYAVGKTDTTFTIPNHVEEICEGAFMYCNGLETVVMPSSVKTIDFRAFLGCKNLTNVQIGENVTHIGGEAFYNCGKLRSIVIPASVTRIQSTVFGYNVMESVVFMDTTTWTVKSVQFQDTQEILAADLEDPKKAAGYFKTDTYYFYDWTKN